MASVHDRIAARPDLGVRVETAKPRSLGDEVSPWFWNPGRIGVTFAPEWFRSKLKEIDEDLEITWNRHDERWQVWVRKPSLQTRLCQGWLYLFPVQDANGKYVPLDERTFAKIHAISARQHGSSRKYFDRIIAEQERDKALREEADQDETMYKAGEFFEFTKPKVGYGALTGSKVVGQ
jgi:hypothetical protein